MRWLILSVIALLAGLTQSEGALDSLLDSNGSIWKLNPDEFMTGHPDLGFRWLSTTSKDTARSVAPGLSFQGLHAFETLARFEGGSLKELTVSLYNRGDAGEVDEADFEKFMRGVDESLTTWAGMKGVMFKTQERTSIAAIRRKSWVKEPHRVDLVWSFSEKSRNQGVPVPRPEYARLQITRLDPAQDPRKSTLATGTASPPKTLTAFELKNRVKHETSGDVLIPGVPMVDQGQKGYCAAAVTERVLRYYGRNLDQHEIAQLANTSAGSGTNPDQMVAALRRVGHETKMDVTVLQDFELKDFEKAVADYNRAAKKARKPEVGFSFPQVDVMETYRAMDPGLFREVRAKRDGPLGEFKGTVAKYIANGAPLVWACIVGLAKEQPDPRGFGGHMRLIIGYNDRSHEVLYTDTWGAGHELKRLPLTDAWSITLGLYSLQPRDVRF